MLQRIRSTDLMCHGIAVKRWEVGVLLDANVGEW